MRIMEEDDIEMNQGEETPQNEEKQDDTDDETLLRAVTVDNSLIHQRNLEFIKYCMIAGGDTMENVKEALTILKDDPVSANQTASNFERIRGAQTQGPVKKSSKAHLNHYEKVQKAKTVKSRWTYKKLRHSMKKQYEQFIVLINGDEEYGWRSVDLGNDTEHFLWEKEAEDEDGDEEESDIYILKASCHMKARPERVVELMTNTNYEKRMRWDPDNLCQVNMAAEDGSVKIVPGIRLLRSISRPKKKTLSNKDVPSHHKYSIVESYIKPPSMFLGIPVPGIAIRRYLVSQWVLHNEKHKEYVILTHSIEDERYPLYKGMVDATGFGGVRIVYDEDEQSCNVTIVAHINPGGNIPSTVVKWAKNSLVTLLKKIKAGCQDPLYSEVYGK